MSAICVLGMKLEDANVFVVVVLGESVVDEVEKRFRLERMLADQGLKKGVLLVVCRPNEEMVRRVSSTDGWVSFGGPAVILTFGLVRPEWAGAKKGEGMVIPV